MATKRKDAPTNAKSPAKKARPAVPEYNETPSVLEEDGSIQWPAPRSKIERARQIIRDCAEAQQRTLIVPDKDADGLSSGAILRHTLMLLGLPEELVSVHLLRKGNTIHSAEERELMAAQHPKYIFIVDHGSRSGLPVIDDPEHVSLIIDHHHATAADFPANSEHVTACFSPPVATSSLLTYEICAPLHPNVRSQTDWLCIVGTHGDLGNTLKWSPPFPDMTQPLKTHTKKLLNDVVSLINAPRRSASYDVVSAWNALIACLPNPSPSSSSSNPKSQNLSSPIPSILQTPRLLTARREVNAEVERCTHTAPSFSPDGKIAVFRISSPAQVHPVIATRWAGHLQSPKLEFVMVANSGYLPDRVNFSCRIPRCARARGNEVSIIERLKYFASLREEDLPKYGEDGEDQSSQNDAKAEVRESSDAQDSKPPLIERLGDDFARGHVQASGGIVKPEEFEELMRLMQIGVKVAKKLKDGDGADKTSPAKKKQIDPGQKNTLMGYFGKSAAAKTASTKGTGKGVAKREVEV